MKNETYLGDGLYASDDGYMITLRAPRETGDHWVGLEDPVFMALIQFVSQSRGLDIKVSRRVVESISGEST